MIHANVRSWWLTSGLSDACLLQVEVIVLCEAIDPLSGITFQVCVRSIRVNLPATLDLHLILSLQARHSYTADDIVFDHTFVSCMSQV